MWILNGMTLAHKWNLLQLTLESSMRSSTYLLALRICANLSRVLGVTAIMMTKTWTILPFNLFSTEDMEEEKGDEKKKTHKIEENQ